MQANIIIPKAEPPRQVLPQESYPVATWEVISPELAAYWLANTNYCNRTIRRGHVRRLAADMVAGRWIGTNAETICFDTQGRLVDAQHRLEACVRSGVAITALVVRGIPDESYPTKGTGAKKSLADFLYPEGHKNSLALAAASKLITIWLEGNLAQSKNGDLLPTVTRQREVIALYPEVAESVDWVANHVAVRRILNPSHGALIICAGCMSGKLTEAENFLTRLGSGLGLAESDVIYHLRRVLEDNKVSRKKLAQDHVLALVIKAWNLFLAQRPVRLFRLGKDEPFPELYLPPSARR